MNWIKIGTYTVIIVPTLFIGIVLGFYLIQDYMIFLGEKLPKKHEYKFNLDYEEYNVEVGDGEVINALMFRTPNSKGLVYYHHGNAGNLQGWGKYAYHFTSLGYDVLFYDYRGYGKSTGKINRQHLLIDDAKALLEKFRGQYDDKIIIYYGISLGSGVAAKLATIESPNALILETPYYNFCELVNHHYPYLPAKLMTKYKLRTNKFLEEIYCPVLIIHGTDDELVPYDHGRRLSEIKDDIELVTIDSGVHNNLTDFKKYHSELSSFLSRF